MSSIWIVVLAAPLLGDDHVTTRRSTSSRNTRKCGCWFGLLQYWGLADAAQGWASGQPTWMRGRRLAERAYLEQLRAGRQPGRLRRVHGGGRPHDRAR